MKISFGFCQTLGLLFVGLKLAHIIDWRWRWVLLPIYGPSAISLLFLLGILILAVVASQLRRP